MGVAVGGLHFEDAVADFENRNIEGAAAEVVDRNGFVTLLVQAVGKRRRRRLVDDPEHFQTGDLAGVLGRLTLTVVEVGRDGDDRLGDGFAEVGFRIGLQFLKDHRGNLRRRVGVVADADVGVTVGRLDDLVRNQLLLALDFGIFAAHQPFDRKDGVFRIGHRLPFRSLADQTLAALGEGDDGRRGAVPFRVGDNFVLAVIHDSHAAVGSAEVDT